MSFDLENFKYTKSALQNSGWFEADLSDILVSDVRYSRAEVEKLLLGNTTEETKSVLVDDISEAPVERTRRRRTTASNADLL